jgi:hypothetical protein
MSDARPFESDHDDGGHDAGYDTGFEALPQGTANQGRRARASLMGIAESRLLDLAEDGKSELARNFDGVVAIVQELAARVDSAGGSAVAAYVHSAADLLGDLQNSLRDKPVDELLDDGRELIRRSPGVAIGVAVVAGFIAARLVKSGNR